MSDHYGSIAINSDIPSPKPQKPQKHRKPGKPAKKPTTPRKSFFLPILVFFFIATYFLTAIYIVPLAIKKYIPRYIQKQSGLTLTIGSARLNPLNFQLTLKQLTADLEKDSTTDPLLSAQSLFIDLDLTSLVRNSFTCDKLTIEKLQLNLIRYKDTHYNIPALSRFSKTPEQGDIIHFATLPFLFSLNNIDINNSRILFEDQVTKKKHTVEDLQLAIPTLSNFDFQSNNYIQPHFSAVINGSPIQLTGEAVQLPDNQGFQTKLSCNIKSLDLVPYFSYLPSTIPLSIKKGWADTTLEISFAPDKRQGDRLSIDIKMDAMDIEMQGNDDTFQLIVPAMKLDAMLTPVGKEFHIRDIITKNIELSGNGGQLQAVLQQIFFPSHPQGTLPPTIIIDRFLTDQSKLTLIDETIKGKPSTSEWSDLQLTIKNFDSTNATGIFHVSGNHAPNKADFSWQGNYQNTETIKGKLLLNNFPAAILFRQLLPESKDMVHGTATLSGDLSISSRENNSTGHTLDDVILQLHDLKFLHGKDTWLKADSIRFTRLSKTADQYNLGNIFLKDASLTVTDNTLPPLLNQLFTAKNHPLIQGIDFEGEVTVQDSRTPKKPLLISEIRFQTNRLEQTSTTENFAFSGQLSQKGIVKAKGVFNLAPIQVEANLAFSNIDSQSFSPFFADWPLLLHSKTVLHGKGTYSYPDSSFQGDLRLTDSLLQTGPETPLLTWKSAELNDVSCRLTPFSLRAESMLLNSPQIQWQRSAQSAFQDLQKGLRLVAEKSAEEKTVFPLEIRNFNLKDASISITDSRLSPAWSTTVNALEGTIRNLNTTKNGLAIFSLTGKLEESPLDLSGALALFDESLEARAGMKLSDLPLKTFHKQLESSTISPEHASLSLELNMIEKDSLFSSKNKIIVTNLQPASLNSDTALALAFLKDTDNSFPLDIAITDSSRSLLKEALTTFQTTVIKASYTPLLLDRRFKDLQDQNTVSFQPGSNQIDSKGKKILGRYAELLHEHPGLGLTITGLADNKIDRQVLQALQEEIEQQRVDSINSQALAEYQKKQQAAILAAPPGNTVKEENIPKKDLAGYKPIQAKPVSINDETLLGLARERSLIVYDFCVHSLNISPRRVTIMNKPEITDASATNGSRIGITTVRSIP